MEDFHREDFDTKNEVIEKKDGNWIYIEFYGEDELYQKVLDKLGKGSFEKNSRELKRDKLLELLNL